MLGCEEGDAGGKEEGGEKGREMCGVLGEWSQGVNYEEGFWRDIRNGELGGRGWPGKKSGWGESGVNDTYFAGLVRAGFERADVRRFLCEGWRVACCVRI